MASIWLHDSNGSKYITCSNIEEAYYHAINLSLQPKSLCVIMSEMTTKPYYIIQTVPFFLAIYNGTFTPPTRFDYEIKKLSLFDLLVDPYYQKETEKIKNMKDMDRNMRKYIKEQSELENASVTSTNKYKYYLL
jgi:hypothetical protein